MIATTPQQIQAHQEVSRSIGWLEKADEALKGLKRSCEEIHHFSATGLESEAELRCFSYWGVEGIWKEGGSGEFDRPQHAVGTYQLAKLLRIPNVAPAHLLTLNGKLGSIHPWIHGHTPTTATWSRQLELFDLLAGNPDRVLKDPPKLCNIIVPSKLTLVPNEVWIDNTSCCVCGIPMRGGNVPHIIEQIFKVAPEELREFCDRLQHLSIPALVAAWDRIGLAPANQAIVLENRETILKCRRMLLSASRQEIRACLPEVPTARGVGGHEDHSVQPQLELEVKLARSLLGEMQRRGVSSHEPMQADLLREPASVAFVESTRAAAKAIAACPDKPHRRNRASQTELIDPGSVRMESLVIPGFDHSVTSSVVQDCALSYHDCDVAVSVVMDGFGSAAFSDLGAKVLGGMFIQQVRDFAHYGHGNGGFALTDPAVLGQLHANMIASVRDFNSGHGIPHDFAYRHGFAATLAACVVTAKETVILSLGDGFVRINRRTQPLFCAQGAESDRPPSLALGSAYSEARKTQLSCQLGELRRMRKEGGFTISEDELQLEELLTNLSKAASFHLDAYLPSKHLERDAITIWSDGVRCAAAGKEAQTQDGILPVFSLVDEVPLHTVKRLILLHNMAADADYFQLNTSKISRLGMLAELSLGAQGWLHSEILKLNDLFGSIMVMASLTDGKANIPPDTSLHSQLTNLQQRCFAPGERSERYAEALEVIEQELQSWALVTRLREARRLPPSPAREAIIKLKSAVPFRDDIAVSRITCMPPLE